MNQEITEQTEAKIVQPTEGEIIEAFGDRMRNILTSADTHGQLFIGLDETPPGAGPPLHVHQCEDELWIIQSGRYEFQIEGEWREAGPGTVVFGPRDIPHTFRVVSDTPGEQYIIAVPGGFERFFKRSSAEFATGAPDVAKIFQIGAEHGISFLTPESAATYHVDQPGMEAPLTSKIMHPADGEVMEAYGNRARFILSAQETNGQFSLIELETPSGFGPPSHIHTYEDEIFIVQSGLYEFQIGDERVQAGPGTVIYGARPTPHAFRVMSEEPGRMFILFRPAGFEQYFRRIGQELADNTLDRRKLAHIGMEHGLIYSINEQNHNDLGVNVPAP